jgi:hypothetical protein
MKHSTLLKKAKKRLDLKTSYHLASYVCNAIELSVKTDEEHALMDDIHRLIQKRLEGSQTLYGWLCKQLSVGQISGATDEQIQNYRLRWMDSLIKEYQEAGK